MTSPNLKRVFLTVMILSLCLAAATGIGVFLFGNFGELEMRILFTTLFLGLFSLTSLCCAALLERRKHHPIGYAGIILSAAALICTLDILWISWSDTNEDLIKSTVILGILAMSLSHSSLLLLAPAKKFAASIIRGLTLVCIGILAGMLSYWVLNEADIRGDLFYRLLGVLAILDVLGTIITPILLVMGQKKSAVSKIKAPAKKKIVAKKKK